MKMLYLKTCKEVRKQLHRFAFFFPPQMDNVTTLAVKSAHKFKIRPQESLDLMTTVDSQGLPDLSPPDWLCTSSELRTVFTSLTTTCWKKSKEEEFMMWKLCPWMKSHWKGATLICSHVDRLTYLMADLSRCHRDYMYGLRSQKYFLCVPLLKKLADPWSPWRVYWCSLYCSWDFPKVWKFF